MKKSDVYLLDELDRKIIYYLMDKEKKSLADIAQKVKVSTTAVHQRVKKLENAKVIENSTAILNTRRIGFKVVSFVGIYLDQPGQTMDIIKALENISEVVEAHYVTGNYSIMVKLICIDNDHLMSVLSEIQGLKGVLRTETLISLGQEINRQLQLEI